VDKPIYPEEVDLYSSLTHNLSTATSCGTVRAGYTVNALVKDKSKASLPISLESCDPITCFNKFLKHHQLPLLPSPQTINSFLLHLIKHSLWNNLQNELIISIKSDYSEAHIYTPQEPCPLPDHQIIPYQSAIFANPHIPLKSYTQYSPPSTLSSIPTNLLTQPSTSTDNSPNNNNTTNCQTIKIHTLNTNGLTTNSKQLLLYNYITENNIDIFGLSETHISEKEGKLLPLTQSLSNYSNYWSSPNTTRKGGVGIYIHTKLSKYIGCIQEYYGHIICLDIFLPNNPLRIIQIYFPTQEKKQLKTEITNQIIKLIQ
jgi:hypothetical protein